MSDLLTLLVTLCAVFTVVDYTLVRFKVKDPWAIVTAVVVAVLFVLFERSVL